MGAPWSSGCSPRARCAAALDRAGPATGLLTLAARLAWSGPIPAAHGATRPRAACRRGCWAHCSSSISATHVAPASSPRPARHLGAESPAARCSDLSMRLALALPERGGPAGARHRAEGDRICTPDEVRATGPPVTGRAGDHSGLATWMMLERQWERRRGRCRTGWRRSDADWPRSARRAGTFAGLDRPDAPVGRYGTRPPATA